MPMSTDKKPFCLWKDQDRGSLARQNTFSYNLSILFKRREENCGRPPTHADKLTVGT